MEMSNKTTCAMTKKKILSYLYTHGKFGKRLREILDVDNQFLYSRGRYLTKIKPKDLPEDYIKIRSRSIWYMTGYIKTSDVVDMYYTYCKENHLFKDDYIYISYKERIRTEVTEWGHINVINYDVCICGNDIINIVLAAEKYSGIDTNFVRARIEEKRIWLRDNEPEEYQMAVGEDTDIFSLWRRKGYVDKKLTLNALSSSQKANKTVFHRKQTI